MLTARANGLGPLQTRALADERFLAAEAMAQPVCTTNAYRCKPRFEPCGEGDAPRGATCGWTGCYVRLDAVLRAIGGQGWQTEAAGRERLAGLCDRSRVGRLRGSGFAILTCESNHSDCRECADDEVGGIDLEPAHCEVG